jgi:hypothetical protein
LLHEARHAFFFESSDRPKQEIELLPVSKTAS